MPEPERELAHAVLKHRKGRIRVAGLPIIQPDTAGIDVGANSVWVAVPPDRDAEPVREFRTFTDDLRALAAWLQQCGVRAVAMEATGVYWIPVCQVLEAAGIEVKLVDARSLKHVSGRKTDVSDCQWLQYLFAVGLLRGAFRPPDVICALRTVVRQRESHVEAAAAQIQVMQKALLQMNLQLPQVLSDLSGKTGLAIIDAILAGERDPRQLAKHRHGRVHASETEIAKALTGDWRSEHLFTLSQARRTYTYFGTLLQECDVAIEAWLRDHSDWTEPQEPPVTPPPVRHSRTPRKNEMQLPTVDLRQELHRLYGQDLTQLPGMGVLSLHTLFAELGPDLSAFPTQGHFCSWLGLCPDPRVSGGRVLRRRTRRVQNRAARIFRLAAQSLARANNPLGAFYRRMRAKLGGPQAVTATAHRLARIFYTLVTTRRPYDESVFARAEEDYEERRLKRLKRDAAALGLQLVPDAGFVS